MKKYLRKKRIFAVIFLLVVISFSVLNFMKSFEPLKELFVGNKNEDIITAAIIENVINENLYSRMSFIETYGFVQVLMDKRESNNFSSIIDENGFQHYASFFREDDSRIFEYAMRLKRLQDSVAQNGTKVLFVVTPGKYNPEKTEFRIGMPVNDPNPVVDELLFFLNRLNVETLDLRDVIPNKELSQEEAFFKTDHHWTIPAAFCATKAVVEKIRDSFGEELDPDGYYTNYANYDIVTYEDEMLGSMGRKTGAVFSDLEDFTAFWPRFEGDFYRECGAESASQVLSYEGSFIQALMYTDVLKRESDAYSDDPYSLYLNGLLGYEKIINREKPDGPSFFMIRDSYFSPVMAFMMPMCGRIDAIWSLEESRELDVESYLEKNTFDYVIMEIYPYNIENKAFNFFKEK